MRLPLGTKNLARSEISRYFILWEGRKSSFWRPEGESNPRVAVLQTAAFPLRHPARTSVFYFI